MTRPQRMRAVDLNDGCRPSSPNIPPPASRPSATPSWCDTQPSDGRKSVILVREPIARRLIREVSTLVRSILS
jgi:hypothetical protein